MKIYSFTLKNIIFYSVFILCAVLLVRFGSMSIADVYNSAESERKLPIYSVDRGEEKICALSFDAAWDDADTDELIEILNADNVKTTFFVVGSWAEKYANSVKKFHDNGHEIMNHSDTHPHINQLSDAKIEEEITKCDEKIEAITGKRPNLFRGPYGEYNNNVISVAEKLGHKVIQWNVETLATVGNVLKQGVAKCAHHTRQKKRLTKPLIATAKEKRKKNLRKKFVI